MQRPKELMMKIMYVEDNPANISLLQRIARMGGHEVINYTNGEVALNNFAQDDPDLVLMDLQLEGRISGLDVVKQLRARGFKTPIVAVTAYAMVGDRERCIEAGCNSYLSKPLPVAELVELVKTYEAKSAEKAETGATDQAKAQPASESASASTETKSETTPQAQPEAATAAPAQAVAETKAETKSETTSESTPESTVESTDEQQPEEGAAEAEREVVTETVASTKSETPTEPSTEVKRDVSSPSLNGSSLNGTGVSRENAAKRSGS